MIQTTIRMPEKLYKEIKREAKEQGVSVNSFIITNLWNRNLKVVRR